jgi:hypothetical protein
MKLSTLNGKMSLISVGTNAKTKKGDSDLAVTAIMYLAPSTISGYETCPSKSKGCSEACLFTAGRGAMNSVQQARVRKTKLFFEKQDQFLANLKNDLTLFDSYCKQEGLQGYVRLNGTSDIKWEDFDLFSSFPNIRFYDYTKRTDGVLLFESSQIAADTIVTLINNKPTEVISQIMELKPLENNFYSWFSNSTSVNVYMRSLHELINFYVIHTKIEDGLVPTVAELNTLKSLSHLYYGLEPLLESYVFRHIFFEYMFIYRTLLISEISKE